MPIILPYLVIEPTVVLYHCYCLYNYNRCIKKMDHHCPWINHCVGHSNHAAFLKFLFFVPFGCLHGVILNVNFLYRFINYVSVSLSLIHGS